MINNRKVRLMTNLAIFEKNNERDMKIAKYYKNDYIRFNLLKTAISVTIAYVCLVVLAVIYNMENIIAQAFEYDFTKAALRLTIGYIVLLSIYLVAGYYIYNYKYMRSKGNLTKYYKRLKILNKMYEDEEHEV